MNGLRYKDDPGRQIFFAIPGDDDHGDKGQRLHCIFLQLIARLKSIFMEHPDCIKGVFIQALADQGQFLEDVVGHGDDMTADLVVAPIGAIQQFARTGPSNS